MEGTEKIRIRRLSVERHSISDSLHCERSKYCSLYATKFDHEILASDIENCIQRERIFLSCKDGRNILSLLTIRERL